MGKIMILFDCSGSMGVLGKRQILQDLWRYWASFSELAGAFYSLRQTLDGCEVLPIAQGKADLQVLAKTFIDESITDALFCSDGNFTRNEITLFQNELKSLEQRKLNLITLAVGADANMMRLEALASNKQCYLAEDVVLATKQLLTPKTQEFHPHEALEDYAWITERGLR